MKRVLAYFIRNYVIAKLFMLIFVVFGIAGFLNLRSSLFPDQPIRMIMVEASVLGASPEEVEEGVVIKIEDNLKGVSGIERTTSTSRENTATITIELTHGADPDRALQDIQNEIDKIATFPPQLERLSVYQQEVLNFTISFALSGDVSLKVLKETARAIEEDFLHEGPISKIEISGFPEEEIEISVRENDLLAFGLTFQEIAQAVERNNIEVTAGTIWGPQRNILIRGENKGYHARELMDIVVRSGEEGALLRLSDVADIRDKWALDPNRSYLNGIRSVTVEVNTTKDEDLLEAAEYVHDYLEQFNQENPLIQATIIDDGSERLQSRMDVLVKDGILGAILVLLFLGSFLNLRVALYVALGIPISFMGMFAMAFFFGISLNLLSLFGMIIVLGILVDDGVVVGENIYQKFEEGEKPFQAALNGTMEVLPSITSGVATTIIAFSLFFFLEGQSGDYFADISFVVTASLIMSLIEVFFLLPARLARTKALSKENRKPNKFERKMDSIMDYGRKKLYLPVIHFILHQKTFAMLILIACLVFTFNAIGVGTIRTTFFPQIELDRINISLELQPGTNDTITQQFLTRIEETAMEVNRQYAEEEGEKEGRELIVNIEKKIGPTTNTGQLVVYLSDPEFRELDATSVAARIRESVGHIPEADQLLFEAGIQFGKPVSVSLTGRDFNELRSARDELKEALEDFRDLRDVADNEELGQPEIHISLRPEARHLGLNLEEVIAQVRQGFFGAEAQRLQRGIDEVIVWVRYDMEERSRLRDLENMRIRTPDGDEYLLTEIARLEVTEGLLSINHLDGRREIRVEADIAHPDVSVSDITMRIQDETLPPILNRYPGVSAGFEGQFREFGKTMDSVVTLLPAILFLMIGMMVFTFKSFTQAIALFLMIPFAMIGAAWGHFVHDISISLFSGLGFIALAGILVNDGLVFVNTFNDRLREGMPLMEALYETGESRFRPIFLTTITTVGGLGPLIFNPSIQAQFLIPMAITVAYGLLVGSILTLTFLPTFLLLANRLKIGWKWLWTGKKPKPEEVENAVSNQKIEME